MTFLMMLCVILLIYADDTTLYSKCDQASDLWQQLYHSKLSKTEPENVP